MPPSKPDHDITFSFPADEEGLGEASAETVYAGFNSSELFTVMSYSFGADDLQLAGDSLVKRTTSNGEQQRDTPADADVNCPICGECLQMRSRRRVLFGSLPEACALCDACKAEHAEDYSYEA